MNQEQQARLSASIYRIRFLMELADYEFKYLDSFGSKTSAIRNVLYRAKMNYEKLTGDLRFMLPNSRIESEVKQSEEKLRAIGTVLERMAVLDEANMLILEEAICNEVKVVYGEKETTV